MPKQNQENSKSSSDTGDRTTTNLSNHFLNALTPQEIAQLIDALFGVLGMANRSGARAGSVLNRLLS